MRQGLLAWFQTAIREPEEKSQIIILDVIQSQKSNDHMIQILANMVIHIHKEAQHAI
jgi:hypothetical protein